MKAQTYEEKIIEFYGENVGFTTGLPSCRKNSNLRHEFDRIHEMTGCSKLYAIAGAHMMRGTEGFKWYVYAGEPPKKFFPNMRAIVIFEY